MGGGLTQLVAYGAQDIYLTGNPQITFFKVVYRRHTNFLRWNLLNRPSTVPLAGSRVTPPFPAMVTLSTDYTTPAGTLTVANVGSGDEDPADVGAAAFDNVEVGSWWPEN